MRIVLIICCCGSSKLFVFFKEHSYTLIIVVNCNRRSWNIIEPQIVFFWIHSTIWNTKHGLFVRLCLLKLILKVSYKITLSHIAFQSNPFQGKMVSSCFIWCLSFSHKEPCIPKWRRTRRAYLKVGVSKFFNFN